MQPTSQQDRPPYVTWEVRAEEDRDASIAAGIYTTKDVDFAIITPAGSKDRIERRVSEWFDTLSQQVLEGRFPRPWADAYRESYKAFKEDRALPETGHSIRNWAVPSPSQIKSLLDLHIRTIEDLAVANEETLARLGMGGRSLKQQAVDWLQSADAGKVSGEMSVLRESNAALALRNESLEEQMKALQAQVAALTGAVKKL